MMDTMEPHARAMANARERINRTELALERTEEMVAENIALCSRLRAQRCLVEAAYRLVEIDPPSNEGGLKA
ncbi:hypothetical protein GCM10010869_21670 [Mesorhizobium tianshanense]|uniref:Uncharacterized protein n=1 Tax=Mesorhizobium tianshanense TaxID=39844 RepID=A0A562MAJ5_9HYPH|nr:hypothetical protein [Mesorhizobium tianshanense]TWI16923.1 hypothetical protein IQ26_07637 [Mesorhizobium tianshanense]GLS36577.1 hypothetical protein GCM10010869_21670 [Mesorhizobium tianshanense]